MASHGKLKATAEGAAMNGHHNGFAHIFYLKQKRKQARASRGFARRDLDKLFYVRAGDECAAPTNQHHSFDAVVFGCLLRGFGNPLRDGAAQGVHGRIIDGDDCDIFVPRELNWIVHKTRSPPSCRLKRRPRSPLLSGRTT